MGEGEQDGDAARRAGAHPRSAASGSRLLRVAVFSHSSLIYVKYSSIKKSPDFEF